MDPLEKERLRRKMALRMQAFAETEGKVTCISAHYVDEPTVCELSEQPLDAEMMVIRNRKGKTMRVALASLREMVRFQVAQVEDLEKWLEKLKLLKVEALKRKEQLAQQREEERKKLERKVMVRKATAPGKQGNPQGPGKS